MRSAHITIRTGIDKRATWRTLHGRRNDALVFLAAGLFVLLMLVGTSFAA